MKEDKDIKILEENIENGIIYCGCGYSTEKAIENLIARYKELEECLKAEESYSKSLNNDIKSLLHIEPNDNFIPKSKVQEKIEELEAMSISKDIYYDDIKRLFQELLED